MVLTFEIPIQIAYPFSIKFLIFWFRTTLNHRLINSPSERETDENYIKVVEFSVFLKDVKGVRENALLRHFL